MKLASMCLYQIWCNQNSFVFQERCRNLCAITHFTKNYIKRSYLEAILSHLRLAMFTVFGDLLGQIGSRQISIKIFLQIPGQLVLGWWFEMQRCCLWLAYARSSKSGYFSSAEAIVVLVAVDFTNVVFP